MYNKCQIAIIYASRYGATKQVSEMIAEHIGSGVDLFSVADIEELPEGYDLIMLGSGIYANKFLPELGAFIDRNLDAIVSNKIVLFGVAMRISMMLDKYDFLQPVAKEMLHGRMDFSQLNDRDRSGLEKFYTARNYTEEQKMERRKLRDEISDAECQAFAERLQKHF